MNIQRRSLTLARAVMQVKNLVLVLLKVGMCLSIYVAKQYCTGLITVVSSQSNMFQCLPKLHPSVTKKQKHWEAVELMWLEFMSDFTLHAEGQLAVPKVQ